MLEEAPFQDRPYSFSGHESFPLRYAWPTKCVRAVMAYEDLFSRPDDLVILGVGKNMVRSMRYWCIALEVLTSPRRRELPQATALGEGLFGDEGWDPYLEDPGTLWLLHWKLVHLPERASTWFLAFSHFTPSSMEGFTRAELADWLLARASERPGTRATKNSIKRDVDVFLRTYTPSKPRGKLPPEDSLDSPLSELGLIAAVEHDRYSFNDGEKPTLPDLIFLYALVEYWQAVAPSQMSLGLDVVARGAGSPGSAFRLAPNAAAARVERLPSWTGIALDDTAGIRQLLRIGELPTPVDILRRYYSGAGDTQ